MNQITLTQGAADHIKALMKEHSLTNHVVRVAVAREAHGYTFDIVEGSNDSDRTYEDKGVKIVCDPISYLYLAATTEVGFDADKGGFTFSPATLTP